MFDELVKFFVVLLVVVEPLSVLPVLAGLTEGADEAWRRKMSFKVQDAKNLTGYKVGDTVEITYTQALAISVK